jgi:V/A-type H+/Na+-transporting ATPase subunit D
MSRLWNEFDQEGLLQVEDVDLSIKKIAGVRIPILNEVKFRIGEYSLFNSPAWYLKALLL